MDWNTQLFYFINKGMENPFFDIIMPPLTNAGGFATLLGICILSVLVLKYLKKTNI